jgi:hypothetical protein
VVFANIDLEEEREKFDELVKMFIQGSYKDDPRQAAIWQKYWDENKEKLFNEEMKLPNTQHKTTLNTKDSDEYKKRYDMSVILLKNSPKGRETKFQPSANIMQTAPEMYKNMDAMSKIKAWQDETQRLFGEYEMKTGIKPPKDLEGKYLVPDARGGDKGIPELKRFLDSIWSKSNQLGWDANPPSPPNLFSTDKQQAPNPQTKALPALDEALKKYQQPQQIQPQLPKHLFFQD